MRVRVSHQPPPLVAGLCCHIAFCNEEIVYLVASWLLNLLVPTRGQDQCGNALKSRLATIVSMKLI